MYHREYPITPSQSAINGALSLYVEGANKCDFRQQLFGLSVLQSGTPEQIHSAIDSVGSDRGIAPQDIHAMLASPL